MASSRSNEEWLTAKRAAELLGVQRATLYAYVSRGLIRAQSDGRTRVYARQDLETVRARADARKGNAALAAGALRFGEPVLDTRITKLDLRGPCYRGVSAVELALRPVSAERVAELLWQGSLPQDEPRWPEPNQRVLLRAAKLSAEELTPLARMQLVLNLVPPAARADSPADELTHARDIVQLLAQAPGDAQRAVMLAQDCARGRDAQPRYRLATTLLASLGGELSAQRIEAVNRALIVIADQELNASAFVARVAAGAGADLARCLLAAFATLSGARHGGACDQIEALARRFEEPEAALSWVRAELAARRQPPGFGHPLYPSGDPRTAPLLAAADALATGSKLERTLLLLREAMQLAGAERPTVDFGLVSLSAALALGPGAALALFALGRSLGHIAHVLEQREQGHLLRPRARYVGD